MAIKYQVSGREKIAMETAFKLSMIADGRDARKRKRVPEMLKKKNY